VHRHDAGHDWNLDAARANPVEIAKIEVVVEEHLGDGAGRAGIDLGLEDIDVGIEVAAFRVLFGIGGDGNLDIAMLPLDAGHQIRRMAVAIRMGGVGGADAIRRIAAKCDDVADADLVIAVDDIVDLAARRADAGQMRGRDQAGLGQDAGDGGVGAFPRRSAGAIGHRDESGCQRRETLDGLPQISLHLLGLRREELKGDRRRFWRVVPIWYGGRNLGHGTTNSTHFRTDVRLSCDATKYAERSWPNSPSSVGSCPIFVQDMPNLFDSARDGHE
jgi:hypothetical protein